MEVEERLEQIINEEVAERMSEVEKEYADQISDLADKLLGLQKEVAKLKGEPVV